MLTRGGYVEVEGESKGGAREDGWIENPGTVFLGAHGPWLRTTISTVLGATATASLISPAVHSQVHRSEPCVVAW